MLCVIGAASAQDAFGLSTRKEEEEPGVAKYQNLD